MQPTPVERSVHSSGVMSSASFGISQENQAHILTILRDTLYTNKILAVLREYTANAWDAHRDVGKLDLPIKVVLPTNLESSLIIRDFGPGLSEHDVCYVYTQYGASTKRGSNVSVGMLGIGSKSAFAYNDSFSITSFNGGLKKVYHAVIDESNIGVVMKLHEAVLGSILSRFFESEEMESSLEPGEYYDLEEMLEPPDEDGLTPQKDRFFAWLPLNSEEAETGVEIKVPVNPSDIDLFVEESRRLFSYFRPLPNINLELNPPKNTWDTQMGFLRRGDDGGDEWVAVMGCIPYRLNISQVKRELAAAGFDNSIIDQLRGGLYFNIGEVDISANREELEYKQRTKDAIVGKFRAVVEEIASVLEAVVSDASLSLWEKRIKMLEFCVNTGLPLPDKYKEWKVWGKGISIYREEGAKDKDVPDYGPGPTVNPLIQSAVAPGEHTYKVRMATPKEFTIRAFVRSFGSRRRVKFTLEEHPYLLVDARARILIKDNTRKLNGYSLNPSDRILVLKEGVTPDEAIKILEPYLAEARVEGVPVIKLSTLPYTVAPKEPKELNPKHKEKCFKLTGYVSSYLRRGYSSNWEVAQRVPDPNDVFVIINRFQSDTGGSFYTNMLNDKTTLEGIFKITVPTIYGIKTTNARPVSAETVVGTVYSKWRAETLTKALEQNPEVMEALIAYQWSEFSVGFDHYRLRSNDDKAFVALTQELGVDHPITLFMEKRIAARKLLRSYERKSPGNAGHLQHLVNIARKEVPNPGKKAFEDIRALYPLLTEAAGCELELGVLVHTHAPYWFEYIRLIDNSKGNPK